MVSRNETFPSRDSRLVSKKCGSLQKVSKHCCGCANTVAIFFFFKLRFPLPLVFQVSMHGRYHNLPVIKPHQDSLSNLCVRSNYGIFFSCSFFSSFHEKQGSLFSCVAVHTISSLMVPLIVIYKKFFIFPTLESCLIYLEHLTITYVHLMHHKKTSIKNVKTKVFDILDLKMSYIKDKQYIL